MPVKPGSPIGPYEVLGPLGAGGMGEVYRARDPRIGRDVAIKVLPSHAGLDADRVRRFEQEARAAGVLNHPNILTVHDVGSANGSPYLVCELLEGETLRAHMGRGLLPVSRVLDIGAQVARGLAAAHACGVVHRDLKPENLFLTRDGRAKILDFGIAKLIERDQAGQDALTTSGGTGAGLIVGTAAYMSPEQVTGRVVDQRSDLFSIGVVLHELLSGASPFGRTTSIETMSAVLSAEPPALESNARVPPALARIVMRCLEKDPDERFQSARDLAFALQTLATPGTGAAGAVAPARRSLRRLPWWVAIAGATAGFMTAWLLLRGAPAAAGTARFTRVVKIAATDAIESSPVLSPDGKWLAYLSNEGGRTNVWVRFLSGGQSVNLTASTDLVIPTALDIGGIDISPDGSQVMFVAAPVAGMLPSSHSLFVVPAPLGGAPRRLATRAAGPRWSPDGQRIVYVQPGGVAGDALIVSDASGTNVRTVVPVLGGIHAHWPTWSADGRDVYFQRGPVSWNAEPTEIWRVAAVGGPPERVIATSRRAMFPYPSADGQALLYSANPDSIDLALWWKPWGREAERITTGIGEYAHPRLSRDGLRMVATVYQVRRSLRAIDVTAESGEVATVTAGSSGDTEPSWSPRAGRLAFASSRSGDQSIWTSRADGTDPRQVTSGPEIDEMPQWSPDGTEIAFVSSRGGARSIWIVAADGGVPRKIVTADVLNRVAWSPDGRELVYAAPAGDVPSLFRVSAGGGTPGRIATPTPGSAPDWSAVTNLIAYVAFQPAASPNSTPAPYLALVRPSGEPVAALRDTRFANGAVQWSPDGKWLAGISRPGGSASSLWLVAADGVTPPRRLLEFPDETRPYGMTWSSDGRRLIFGLQERTADIVLFEADRATQPGT